MKKIFIIFILIQINSLFAQKKQWQDSTVVLLQKIKTQLPNADSGQFHLAQKAVSFAEQSKNDSLLMMSLYYNGVLHYYAAYYLASNYFYQKALTIAQQKNYKQIEYRLSNNLGINYDMLGETESSLIHYQSALELLKKQDNQKGIAQVQINLGRLFRISRDFEKSEQLLNNSLAYFLQVQDTFYIGLTYQNLASLYSDLKKNEEIVLNVFNQALNYYKSIDYQYGIVELYHNLGDYYQKVMHDNQKTKIYFTKALEISQIINTHTNSISLSLALAKLSLEEEKYNEAITYANQSLKQAGQQKIPSSKLAALKTLVHIYLKSNKSKEADLALESYFTLSDSVYDAEKVQSFNELAMIYNLNEKNQLLKEKEMMIENNYILNQWMITAMVSIFILSALIIWFLKFRNQKLREQYQLNRQLFEKENQKLKQINTNSFQEPDDLTSGNNPELFEKIEDLINHEKLFTNSELNISYIAELLHTNHKYISQAINNHSGMSFTHYINKKRVQEARYLIEENGKLGLSLEQVMNRSGFRSRTTFTEAFKRFTGMTPGQYQKYAHENK